MQERLVTLSHELAAAEESQHVQAEAAAAEGVAAAVQAQHYKDELSEQLERWLQAKEGTSQFDRELEDDVASTVTPSDKGFSATVVCYGCYSTAD
jgi:hypothetical protein